MTEFILRRPLLWLLLLCAVNFFAFLGGHTLWDVDEPNNAVCAREMLLAGNWWTPMFNGALRFDKPILIYWLMMPLNALFGVNEWTARLPSALSMSGLVIVIWKMGERLLGDRKAALMAATLFAAALHVIIIARAAVPDPLLMLSLGFALPAFLIVYLEQKERPSAAMPKLLLQAYVALGLGLLAKGPVAGLMPVLVLSAFLTLTGDWKGWRTFHPFKGAAIALLIALPWYVGVGVITDGEWLHGFIFHHNLDRFSEPLQGHRGFPGLYIVSYLLGWFPWTGLLAATLLFGSWRLKALRAQPLRLFMLCWAGAFIIFFSIARTQLPNYILPAFPAAAFLMAGAWLHAGDADRRRAACWMVVGAMLLSTVIMLAGGIAIDKKWPGESLVMLAFAPLLIAAVWLLWRRRNDAWIMLAAAMMACVLLLSGWSVRSIDHHKVARELARQANVAGFDGESLATFRYFQPSLLYYHGGVLPRLATPEEVGDWLVQGKAVVTTQNALAELPAGIAPYLIVHKRVFGLYARRWLMLISLKPLKGDE
jgi:4-amino-4-deoxy-L-arabinose transferase-like glycosyltransferase